MSGSLVDAAAASPWGSVDALHRLLGVKPSELRSLYAKLTGRKSGQLADLQRAFWVGGEGRSKLEVRVTPDVWNRSGRFRKEALFRLFGASWAEEQDVDGNVTYVVRGAFDTSSADLVWRFLHKPKLANVDSSTTTGEVWQVWSSVRGVPPRQPRLR